LASDGNSPISASQVAGITGMYHHIWPVSDLLKWSWYFFFCHGAHVVKNTVAMIAYLVCAQSHQFYHPCFCAFSDISTK
jgi:hypothetical protein